MESDPPLSDTLLFSLDGLLVADCEAKADSLSVAEGQQLLSLYRLLHRLHSVGSATALQSDVYCGAVFPEFLRPVRSAAGNESSLAPDTAAQDCSEGTQRDHSAAGPDGAGSGNANRSANGMEGAHVRGGPAQGDSALRSRGGEPMLRVLTSQREMCCGQRILPETNDAVFVCSGVNVA